MNICVGTSGYSYKEWKRSFYPEDLPTKGMLHYYGERFRTVEINNTFYRLPKKSVLDAWAGEVPADFNARNSDTDELGAAKPQPKKTKP